MSKREPIQIVEIDVDYCSLTYGQSPCAAALGTTGEHKCFNMYFGCQSKQNFARITKTVKFAQPRPNLPKGETIFPILISATPRSSSVNIGGTDPRLNALGKRATVRVDLEDISDSDRFWDKYQSERMTGAAQSDGEGYNPRDRGTMLQKLRARWPYYAGRAMRLVDAYVDGGVISEQQTRHYVITNFTRNSRGGWTVEGRDVLELADEKNAVLPKPTRGILADDISDTATTLTLTPEGIGDQDYATSGKVTVGSEIMRFTRSGDTLTLTERGSSGTTAKSHAAKDAAQQTFSVFKERIDTVLQRVFSEGTTVPSEYLPLSEWASEIDRWAPDLLLTTDITKPEGVAKLIGELSVLGVNIWPYDTGKKIGLKMIRPVDGDTLFEVNDDTHIKEIDVDDRDKDRLTEIAFYTVLTDPTQSSSDPKNYARAFYPINQDVKIPLAFGDTKIKEITCRWLNHGDDGVARTVAIRMLNRLSTSPERTKMLLDADMRDINLTSVVDVTSRMFDDGTGQPERRRLQVVSVEANDPGHDFYIEAQTYQYDGRFGFVAPDNAPTYANATDAQRSAMAFAVGGTLQFTDGSGPYEAI